MFFSIVVPVYNRPKEIGELLESLLHLDYKDFEVLIVEDGSSVSCERIVNHYKNTLDIRYFYQENQGQGFARNLGMNEARGDYFVLFDSDCIVPSHYLSTLKHALVERRLDAHGGPDAAAENFSVFQKALDFSMTSLLTTGGIRGKLKDPAKYQARGYNMGLSKAVFEETQGFVDPNKAEDIELSIRIKKLGYRLELVEEAFVYHKRRNTFTTFLIQSFSFGRNRVNVSRYHPGAVKAVHFLPLFFLLAILGWLLISPFSATVFYLGAVVFGFWTLGVLVAATFEYQSIAVGLVAVASSYGQLLSYGMGLLFEGIRKMLKG